MSSMSNFFSKGGSESKSTSQGLSKEQKGLLKDAISTYQDRIGQGANIFPDSRVSPFSSLQSTATGAAGNFANLFSTPTQVGTPLFGETGSALQGHLAGTSGAKPMTQADTSQFFQGAIADPTMRDFRTNVIPGIQESFSGPGFYGAARSQELSEATQNVSANLSSQRAALDFDVLKQNQALEESAANRSLSAVPQAINFSQLPAKEVQNNLNIASQQLGGLGQIFGFGQAEQTQAQAELQDEITRFAEENSLTDPEDLAIIMGLLGVDYSKSKTRSSSDTAEGGAGMVGAGISAVAAMISDARVKENVKPFKNPLAILRKLKPVLYNYKGQDREDLGLMAQEIEKVLPQAVIEVDGVKHVRLYAIQTLIIGALTELLGDKNYGV